MQNESHKMNTPIRGKVAKILNSREVALNIGSNDGVRTGMYFDVMDPKCQNITDPDTGTLLGSIEKTKVRVKVMQVQDRLSLVATHKTRRVNIGGRGGRRGDGRGMPLGEFARALMPPAWGNETLKAKNAPWEDLDEKESFVKRGNPVVQALSVEEEVEQEEAGKKQHLESVDVSLPAVFVLNLGGATKHTGA